MATNSPSGPAASAAAAAASAASEREQKLLEPAMESLLQRVAEIKGTIAGLIAKLENDPRLNWPSFLDSYSLVSGQLNSLLKAVKSNDRTPPLKKFVCLPLALSPDRDEELLRVTEGRVGIFAFDLVPDYLRTKPDPEVEQRHAHLESRAANTNVETATRGVTVNEKITTAALKLINREREDLEGKASIRAEIEATCSLEDTFVLVAAVGSGKGLRSQQQPGPPGMMQARMMGGGGPGGVVIRPGGGGPPGGAPGMGGPVGKAPSTIKTNIKTASQVNPYARQ